MNVNASFLSGILDIVFDILSQEIDIKLKVRYVIYMNIYVCVRASVPGMCI